MSSNYSITGNLIDIHQSITYPAVITVSEGRIVNICATEDEVSPVFILPGLIDAHIHVESSMVSPASFAAQAVLHGTIATVSDPHEIANVCGMVGIQFMLDDAGKVPFSFNFGAPSCVPATAFETSGAILDAKAIQQLLARKEIKYLAEMMNFPGVLNKDEDVMEKIKAAYTTKKPIDGHAPGLRGHDAKKYAEKGISTEHECTCIEEALDKIEAGMNILIREGSAAKNFEALHHLISSHPDKIMLCSDDKHPDDFLKGHINLLVKRALGYGHDLYNVLKAACWNPIQHYNLEIGTLRIGDDADFIIINNLQDWTVIASYFKGEKVMEDGKCLFNVGKPQIINHFNCRLKCEKEFAMLAQQSDGCAMIPVIHAIEGQITTQSSLQNIKIEKGFLQANPLHDILKIAVVNRYQDAAPSMGFIRGFGLRQGAIASSVAHDSHNIVCVGTNDSVITKAVNAIINAQGGIVACNDEETHLMPLPIAGLMSEKSVKEAAQEYEQVNLFAKTLGCSLSSAFMTLSFMALPVIPELKITDKGLFDVAKFEFKPKFYQSVR